MQPNQDNPYNFILDPNSKQKSSGPSFLNNPNQRNIIAGIFVAVVLLLVFAAIAVFQSIGKQGNAAIVDVQAYQTELVRLSEEGLKEAQDPNTKITLSTFNAAIGSDLQAVTSYLTGIGVNSSEERLAQSKAKGIDDELQSAQQRGAYDQAVLEAIQDASDLYKAALGEALEESGSEKRTDLLQKAGENILTFDEQS